MIRIHIAVIVFLGLLLTGCNKPKEPDFPGDLTIQDLAPINPDNTSNTRRLKTLNLDLNIMEIPIDNFNMLDEIRRNLKIEPIKFNSYLAFSENYFSVYFGQFQNISTVYGLLEMAGAQNLIRQALMLPDGESENIPIKQIMQMQTIDYTSLRGDKEKVRVEPGYLTMYLEVKKSLNAENKGTVIIYPLYSLMTSNTIPELDMRFKLRDFAFDSTALKLDMQPGDFIFIAPERFIMDQTTLSGLFFSNPYGTVFMNLDENRPPERKPSFRVYVLTCVGNNL